MTMPTTLGDRNMQNFKESPSRGAPFTSREVFAPELETRATQIDTDLLAFKAANHSDLTQLDTDLLAFKSANHTDLTQIDTDLLAFKSANHTDLTLIDTDLLAFKTQAHSDSQQLDTDLLSFKAASHTDLTLIDTDLNAFKTQAHSDSLSTQNILQTEFDQTQVKQDTGNASLASIDGKLADNFGGLTSALRTASIPGNVSGIADFNAGTTGAQTPRTTANITRNGTEWSYNAGTSDANTPRTASNMYAVVRSSAPSIGVDGDIRQLQVGSSGSLQTSNLGQRNTEWGQMFSLSTDEQALSGTSEVAFLLFKNPSGSGKIAKLYRFSVEPTLGNNYVRYKFYRDPTVTANGTPISVAGNRDTNQASAVVTPFFAPTISANGTRFRLDTDSGLSGVGLLVPFDFTLWVEPNHSILVTRDLSANATIGGVSVEWAEQVG